MKLSVEWCRENPAAAAEKLDLYAGRIEALERALGVEHPGDRQGAEIRIEMPVGRAVLKAHNPNG